MKEKNYLLTHKILPILSVFILVSFLLCTSSFGAESSNSLTFYNEYIDKDVTLEFDNIFNYDYFYITYNSNGSYDMYHIICSDNPISYELRETGGVFWCHSGVTTWYELYPSNHSKGNGLLNSSNSDLKLYQSFNSDSYEYYSGGLFHDLVFSNFDVYTYDYANKCFTDNLVFQAAPSETETPTQETQAVELVKAIQVQEIPQQIAGILKIVLPIFLAIFGVLLVLYLIKSKNLLHL